MNFQQTVLGACALLFLVVSCGGSQKSTKERMLDEVDDDVDLIEDLTGISDETAIASEEELTAEEDAQTSKAAEADPDDIGGPNGAFIAKIVISGEEVAGTFNVATATDDAQLVRENVAAGDEIVLEPGVYDFTFITDKIAGSPPRTIRDVEIPAGRRVRKEIKIPAGEITLVTGQKRCVKKKIRIRLKAASDWLEGKFHTCVPIILLAGEYEADIVTGKHSTPVSGIQVHDGGKRSMVIHSQ